MDIGDMIMKHVLRFVPAKSLCRFKAVCSDWNRWISSPFLAHQQATHFKEVSGFFCQTSDQDPFFISLDERSNGVPNPSLSFFREDVRIRSSCNGLLCCQSCLEDNIYFICNPATREWKELPEPTLYHGPASAVAVAFTPSTYNFDSHFEIVCAIPFDSVKAVYFEIYSSRTNSWRVAESQYYYEAADALTFKGDGFCMNRLVYWETSNGVILGFHLQYEEHGELQLPAGHGQQGILTEMHGELCYIMPHEKENNDEEPSLGIYGEHDMVLKRRIPLDLGDFTVHIDGEMRVLSSVNDDVVMILVGCSVIAYDVEERAAKVVKQVSPADHAGRYLPYVNSLARVCPVEKMPKNEVADYYSLQASDNHPKLLEQMILG